MTDETLESAQQDMTNTLSRVKQEKATISLSFTERMNRLEKLAALSNPFYNAVWSLPATHGITKAIQMLFPNGRKKDGQPVKPSKATIEKTRRFLRAKVKRHVDANDQSTSLPTVDDLMRPGLFEADLGLHSRLRIRGLEVLTPCVLPKIIWLAVSALQLQTKLADNPSASLDGDPPKDSKGRYVAHINQDDIPTVAQWLQTYCVIPGGPWSVAGAISEGLPVEQPEQLHPFQTMQAKLLQGDQRKTAKRPVVKTPKSVAIVYK